MSRGTWLKYLSPLGKSSASLGEMRGIVSGKWHVSDLKNYRPEHSKKSKKINRKINAQASGFSQGSFVNTKGKFLHEKIYIKKITALV